MSALSQLDRIDKNISKWFHQLDHIVSTVILYPFAAFFHPGLIWIPYLSILYLSQYNVGFTFLYVIATLICLILTTILKKMIKRPTLNPKVSKPHNFRSKEKNNSMPSGDAFQSAVFVVFLTTFNLPQLPLALFHLGVCLGRVYYMCHWLGDTIISTIIGSLLAKILLETSINGVLTSIPQNIL